MKGWESLDAEAFSDFLILSSVNLGNVLRRVPGGHSLCSLGVLGGKALAVSANKKLRMINFQGNLHKFYFVPFHRIKLTTREHRTQRAGHRNEQ